MTIPSGAIAWAQPLDPSDRADYIVQMGSLLEEGEIIASATVRPLPEAVALGLVIIEDEDHGPWIANDTNIELWFEIVEELREAAIFKSTALLPIEITIDTDADLPRRFQRTLVLKVVQL